eukprot:4942872-Prymnesium_polylepis.1
MAGRGREEGGAKRAFERCDVMGPQRSTGGGSGCSLLVAASAQHSIAHPGDTQVSTPSTAHKRWHTHMHTHRRRPWHSER